MITKETKLEAFKAAMDHKLENGKHKGLTISEVININPRYITSLIARKSTPHELKKKVMTVLYSGLLLGGGV